MAKKCVVLNTGDVEDLFPADETQMPLKHDKCWSGAIGLHGGYRALKSYQNDQTVYATVQVCKRLVDLWSPTASYSTNIPWEICLCEFVATKP